MGTVKFHSKFEQLRSSGANIRNICKTACPAVWRFPLFSSQQCAEILSQVLQLADTSTSLAKTLTPDGMSVLDIWPDTLLQDIESALQACFIRPVYPKATLRLVGAFVVKYSEKQSHALHEDSSDLTLNVCLGSRFKGGSLAVANHPLSVRYFAAALPRHLSSSSTTEELEKFYTLKDIFNQLKFVPGEAFLHDGRHPHAATPITEGTRFNLIMWFRLHHICDAAQVVFPFLNLPSELQEAIAQQLPLPSLCALSQCSRTLNAICGTDAIWRHLYEQLCDALEPDSLPDRAPDPFTFAPMLLTTPYSGPVQRTRIDRTAVTENFRAATQNLLSQHAAAERLYREDVRRESTMWLKTIRMNDDVVTTSMCTALLPLERQSATGPTAVLGVTTLLVSTSLGRVDMTHQPDVKLFPPYAPCADVQAAIEEAVRLSGLLQDLFNEGQEFFRVFKTKPKRKCVLM
eukprot:TRINITY_DN9036_c0_g1_i1.p1 TRINITY_DN9036_c0_g1~~TRINITY_DN9036_c0_g1_i1.p1  ORF type:complete len:460 (+),score=63.92 TRINITY_DN9036_c0_g1_i1:83-1462(+)